MSVHYAYLIILLGISLMLYVSIQVLENFWKVLFRGTLVLPYGQILYSLKIKKRT